MTQSLPMMNAGFLTVLIFDPREVAARQDLEEAVAVRRESRLKNTYLVVEERRLLGERSVDCCQISCILLLCPTFSRTSVMIIDEQIHSPPTHLSSIRALVHKDAVPLAFKCELSSILSRIHLLFNKLTNWVSSGVLWPGSNPALNSTVLCEPVLKANSLCQSRRRSIPSKSDELKHQSLLSRECPRYFERCWGCRFVKNPRI